MILNIWNCLERGCLSILRNQKRIWNRWLNVHKRIFLNLLICFNLFIVSKKIAKYSLLVWITSLRYIGNQLLNRNWAIIFSTKLSIWWLKTLNKLIWFFCTSLLLILLKLLIKLISFLAFLSWNSSRKESFWSSSQTARYCFKLIVFIGTIFASYWRYLNSFGNIERCLWILSRIVVDLILFIVIESCFKVKTFFIVLVW